MKRTRRQDDRPAFLFYPRDYLSEPGLALCDLDAHGLWILMLCWMHLSEQRGKLIVNSRTISAENLHLLVGKPESKVQAGLKQLVDFGVCEIASDGTIYNRRMVEEAKQTDSKRRAGSLGGRASKTQAALETETEDEEKRGKGGPGETGPAQPSGADPSASLAVTFGGWFRMVQKRRRPDFGEDAFLRRCCVTHRIEGGRLWPLRRMERNVYEVLGAAERERRTSVKLWDFFADPPSGPAAARAADPEADRRRLEEEDRQWRQRMHRQAAPTTAPDAGGPSPGSTDAPRPCVPAESSTSAT